MYTQTFRLTECLWPGFCLEIFEIPSRLYFVSLQGISGLESTGDEKVADNPAWPLWSLCFGNIRSIIETFIIQFDSVSFSNEHAVTQIGGKRARWTRNDSAKKQRGLKIESNLMRSLEFDTLIENQLSGIPKCNFTISPCTQNRNYKYINFFLRKNRFLQRSFE